MSRFDSDFVRYLQFSLYFLTLFIVQRAQVARMERAMLTSMAMGPVPATPDGPPVLQLCVTRALLETTESTARV